MPRTRMVKPEFFTHGGLYDAEIESGLPLRLAFEGMWCQADREGRFAWKPRELKLAVLPYDAVDFSAVLDALERHGFLRRYVVAGKAYGVIPTLGAHQWFHKTERASTLPPPPDNGESTVKAPLDNGGGTGSYPADTDTDTDTEKRQAQDQKLPAGKRPTLTRRVRPARQPSTEPAAVALPDGNTPHGSGNGSSPPPPPNWVAEGSAWWREHVGETSEGKFGAQLKASVDRRTWPLVFRALRNYAAEQKHRRKPARLDWFVAEVSSWIDEVDGMVYDGDVLTAGAR